MRKLFFFVATVLLTIILSACFGGTSSVTSLQFSLNDGALPPQFYSEADLTITPIYDDRTLKLEYNMFYPHRTEETLDEDISTEGIVGGENFDRFEQIVGIVEDIDLSGLGDEMLGAGTLRIDLKRSDGRNVTIETYWTGEIEGLEDVQDFYLDLVALLTAEVPI